MIAAKLRERSQNDRIETGIIIGILVLSVIIGIIVGRQEEWISPRNFTAGYMVGSLTSIIILFSIYRFISFIAEKLDKKRPVQ
ncbi:hypothetical protein MM221_16380 [Salipaludibacillus sp. LMS25]|jgi:ABC-type transport system involved in multi-copper enzyme maturation permease subunit|uniref:hypothetical protein n=1 Tax=Salipaludibacillus sp. LMS25 TaxID=2924031 RepID=UPI0020D080D3|nr:hypothetical protein [Salipaludibacillus sp. LMS25]UTR14135.1 hypothetical protein MM221_16380 [Salipaludibacillus sp. LMS25]